MPQPVIIFTKANYNNLIYNYERRLNLIITELYKNLLLERKFGVNTNVMATKMIPSLAPQTVNPALNVDQFSNLMEVYFRYLSLNCTVCSLNKNELRVI